MRGNIALVASLVILLLFPAAGGAAERGEVLFWTLPLQLKLDKSVSCSFQQTPLSEVLQFFRGTLDINLVLAESASQFAEKPITLAVRDIPAHQALTWALRQAGLQYVFANGVVYVAERQQALRAEPVSFRQYDVSDLLTPLPTSTGTSTATSGTGTGTTTGSGTTTGGTSSSGAEDLIRLIVIFTGRENWDEVVILGASTTTSSGVETRSREDRF